MRNPAIFLLWTLLCYLGSNNAASTEEWKSRTIYQLLTDRFGRSDDSTSGCGNLGNYCGGTFQGIINHLDYIQDMGFDAIWISPVPQNTPGGYHGYWQQNFYEINSNFGSKEDLVSLVKACHAKGIWVMLDVVGNHVGPVGYDYSSIVPFNQQSDYHGCSSCPSNCQIQDFGNQQQVQLCRLAGLPDLDQSNQYVADTLNDWVRGLISNYSFDGLRIDTVPEVNKNFWSSFVQAAGCYAVGEVYNGDVSYVSGYQGPTGPLPGTLSYPMFFTLRNVFDSKNSMYNIQTTWQQYQKSFGDLDALGSFIDNHDQVRFLNGQQDKKLYEAAIIYVLMGQGIPIIYYGTEQGFSGGADPNNREVLWPTRYQNNTELYQVIKQVIGFRKQNQIWKYPQIQRYVDDNFYAFTRGDIFVALTNGGSSQPSVEVTITYHPYKNGQKLCNLFYPTTDCFVVQNNQFDVYLANGQSKIYYPAN